MAAAAAAAAALLEENTARLEGRRVVSALADSMSVASIRA